MVHNTDSVTKHNMVNISCDILQVNCIEENTSLIYQNLHLKMIIITFSTRDVRCESVTVYVFRVKAM
jgi:hypothetical protein